MLWLGGSGTTMSSPIGWAPVLFDHLDCRQLTLSMECSLLMQMQINWGSLGKQKGYKRWVKVNILSLLKDPTKYFFKIRTTAQNKHPIGRNDVIPFKSIQLRNVVKCEL